MLLTLNSKKLNCADVITGQRKRNKASPGYLGAIKEVEIFSLRFRGFKPKNT